MNSIEVYEYVCRYLAYTGNMIVVAPDYHLAPEYKFPAGLNEAYETLVWTKNNIGLYYGDEGNISVAGDSSGGNLQQQFRLWQGIKKDRKFGNRYSSIH